MAAPARRTAYAQPASTATGETETRARMSATGDPECWRRVRPRTETPSSRPSYQQRRHQHRYGPQTRVNPGRQYGPHPLQATCSIGVKFCAAVPMLPAPREVCAEAVKAADPASSRAIARVRVTLRIGCSPWICGIVALNAAIRYFFVTIS
jgi:hypothetical protein